MQLFLNLLFNQYTKTKTKTIKYNLHKEYKTLRNRINSILQHSKTNYYKNYFTQYSNNVKKVWIGIKEVINIKSKTHNIPNCIEVNNKAITDKTEICNSFNDYYSTIAENILDNNKTPILRTFDTYLKNPSNTSFAFELCDPTEIVLLINELDPLKSSGPNGIPTKILQMISEIISVPLRV